MSNLNFFMKGNLKTKENAKFAATKNLCDNNGNALEWEIKSLSTKDDAAIRNECTMEVPVKGKPNLYRPTLNTNQYIAKMLVASVVFPDLCDAELQDSYGVKTPEDLLQEMICEPGEYNEFALFVQKFNGFVPMEEMMEQAKN